MIARWRQQQEELSPLRRAGRWWSLQPGRTKLMILLIALLVILFACLVPLWLLGRALEAALQATPTPTSPPPSPTAAATQPATATPTLPTPTLSPIVAVTQEPVLVGAADPPGDVRAYETGELVEAAPLGIDIRVAGIGPDGRVSLLPTEEAPAQLAAWVNPGEVLLWMRLHEPIPEPMPFYSEWLFALDVDGNPATGRPVGSARINPDLGMEVAIGLYESGGQRGSYLLVWNSAQGALQSSSVEVRYTLNDTRSAVGLAVSLEALTRAVAENSGVTLDPAAITGRAAALTALASGERVIDFYPDLPE